MDILFAAAIVFFSPQPARQWVSAEVPAEKGKHFIVRELVPQYFTVKIPELDTFQSKWKVK